MSTVIEEFVAKLGWEVDPRGLKNFKSQANDLGRFMRNVGVAVVAGTTAIAGGIAFVVREFSKIENAEAAFTPLLGSVEKAKTLIGELNKTAATTPFQFTQLANAAQQLLPNMAGDIDLVIERIRMLGDTAGGDKGRMQSAIRSYNRILLKGKADLESLNIASEAGIPIMRALGETMELSADKLFNSISAGEVSTEDVTAAFKHMTSEGGIYFRGMEIASKTVTGRISTLKDNVMLLAAEVGQHLAPEIKAVTLDLIEVAKQAKEWAKANKDVIKSKFLEYVKDLRDVFRNLVDFASFLGGITEKFGGLLNTLKLIAAAVFAIKLAPLLITIGQLIAVAPTLGAVLSAAGAAVSASWLPVAALLLGLFVITDDIYGSLSGKRSLGGIIEEKLGLSDALGDFTAFIAALNGVDVNEFYLKLTQDGLGSALSFMFSGVMDRTTEYFKAIADLANDYIADPLIKVFFAIPDTIYAAFVNLVNKVGPLLSRLTGVSIPKIKMNSFSGYTAEMMKPTTFKRAGSVQVGGGNGAPITVALTTNVETNASAERIAFASARHLERALDRARSNAGK